MSTQKPKKVQIMLFVWTVGLFGRLAVLLLQAVGLIRVEGIQNLRALLARNEGFLVIHRHPSLREIVIIPLLFVPWALWNWKKVPVVTPDEHNFYAPWWCSPLRPLAIAVPRGDSKGMGIAGLQMRHALFAGRPVILAPEGGRTFKGAEFKYLLPCGCTRLAAQAGSEVDLSLAIIRRFQGGAGALCGNNKVLIPVLPVWVSSKGRRTRICFGKPTTIPAEMQDRTGALEDLLLQTSRNLRP